MQPWIPPVGVKTTYPWIHANHPDYIYKPGGDVQSIWRKYGWTPPSEKMTPPPPEKSIQ